MKTPQNARSTEYSFRSVWMYCGTNRFVCKPIKAEKRFGCASRKCNCARSIYLHQPTIENAVYCGCYLILLLLLLVFLLLKSIFGYALRSFVCFKLFWRSSRRVIALLHSNTNKNRTKRLHIRWLIDGSTGEIKTRLDYETGRH